MKTFGVRICVSMLSLLGLSFAATETQAAGPVTAQQSLVQVQSAVADASVGCWHCRRGWRRGYVVGYGSYAYGYPSYGYGGYGGYYGGYRGGYYSGYSPSYSYSVPQYYSTYSYSAPYQSSCCGYTSYQPTVYSTSSYSYPAQSYAYNSSVYSQPAYSQPAYSQSVYSQPAYSAPAYGTTSTYGYGSAVYAPSYSTPSAVTPTLYQPSTYQPASGYATPVQAPYPAPPADIQGPSAYSVPTVNGPVAVTYPPAPISDALNSPVYAPTFTYASVAQGAYSPINYSYSGMRPAGTAASYNLVW